MSAHPLRRRAVLAVWATDLGLLGFALTNAALGRLLGFPALGAIAAVATLPLAVLIVDILPQRGAIVGGLVIALGSLMIPAAAGPMPLLAWSLLALAGVTAVMGPAMALPNEVATIQPRRGQSVTIIVECQGPSERGGIAVRPKASPRFDPERRSLTRRQGARQPGQVAGLSARNCQVG